MIGSLRVGWACFHKLQRTCVLRPLEMRLLPCCLWSAVPSAHWISRACESAGELQSCYPCAASTNGKSQGRNGESHQLFHAILACHFFSETWWVCSNTCTWYAFDACGSTLWSCASNDSGSLGGFRSLLGSKAAQGPTRTHTGPHLDICSAYSLGGRWGHCNTRDNQIVDTDFDPPNFSTRWGSTVDFSTKRLGKSHSTS